MNIYKKSQQQAFSDLFVAPSALFRGAPFWSWNATLNRDSLLRQIEVFKEMGIGGYTIHPRTGLGTEYMGDAYMEHVQACLEKGRELDMLTWLYDEDRWPSGYGGGLVTRDPQYRARYLVFTPEPYAPHEAGAAASDSSSAVRRRNGEGRLLTRYAVRLQAGALDAYRRLKEDETPVSGEPVWYAYLEVMKPSSWFNNQTYVDTLNPQAIKKFIEVTHERYRQALEKDFGGRIPAIFTDEPQFTHKTSLSFADEKKDLVMPWTDDLSETYRAAYGADPLDTLPEVFWELPEGAASVHRYRYHDYVAERFASAFADTIGDWCEAHGIALTGHMMEEPTLTSQSAALGEAMRSYRGFQLPGIDMLCDWREYTTAKQAQSASRQYGRGGMLSELYGVTDWDFDFRGHKSQGDWQAALGVTVRVHHLSWVSMKGEAKRDYPASILHQSPWYKKYPVIEDHFARVNVAMTRGKARVRVGVIHPIESFWLCLGPRDQTGRERQQREATFRQLAEWLLFGQMDFDFICEALLPELNPVQQGARFRVGEMAYDVVVVPPMRTMRVSTLERLEAFAGAGGTVLFAGEVPALVDVLPDARPTALAAATRHLDFDRITLLNALEPWRELEVLQNSGAAHEELLYQWRQDGDDQYLFLCDTRPEKTVRSGVQDAWCAAARPCRLRLRGHYALTELDTATGEQREIAGTRTGEWTEWRFTFYAAGHQLLRLRAVAESVASVLPAVAVTVPTESLCHLCGTFPVTLAEPNALLMDQPEWRWNGGEWVAREEILRITNAARANAGLKPLTGQIAQPWTNTDAPLPLGMVELRYPLHSEVDLDGLKLALEDAEETEVLLDGVPVTAPAEGWWVDECLATIPLPALSAGEHQLTLIRTLTDSTSLEACYLLGDFGVRLQGRDAVLTPPVRRLSWGSITGQGLPFYTGNLTYHLELVVAADGAARLQVLNYAGAMVGVRLDGGEEQNVVTAPYDVNLGTPQAGLHTLDLVLYGNRFNAFGAVHCAHHARWAGPTSYRTRGPGWCYEYNLRPLGILTAPLFFEAS